MKKSPKAAKKSTFNIDSDFRCELAVADHALIGYMIRGYTCGINAIICVLTLFVVMMLVCIL